jgi:hypothetical protein
MEKENWIWESAEVKAEKKAIGERKKDMEKLFGIPIGTIWNNILVNNFELDKL